MSEKAWEDFDRAMSKLEREQTWKDNRRNRVGPRRSQQAREEPFPFPERREPADWERQQRPGATIGEMVARPEPFPFPQRGPEQEYEADARREYEWSQGRNIPPEPRRDGPPLDRAARGIGEYVGDWVDAGRPFGGYTPRPVGAPRPTEPSVYGAPGPSAPLMDADAPTGEDAYPFPRVLGPGNPNRVPYRDVDASGYGGRAERFDAYDPRWTAPDALPDQLDARGNRSAPVLNYRTGEALPNQGRIRSRGPTDGVVLPGQEGRAGGLEPPSARGVPSATESNPEWSGDWTREFADDLVAPEGSRLTGLQSKARDMRKADGPESKNLQREAYRPIGGGPAVMDLVEQAQQRGETFAPPVRLPSPREQAEGTAADAAQRAQDNYSPLNEDWGWIDLTAGFLSDTGQGAADLVMSPFDGAARNRARVRGDRWGRALEGMGETVLSDATLGDFLDEWNAGEEARRAAGEEPFDIRNVDLVDTLWRGPSRHGRESRYEGVYRDALADFEERNAELALEAGQPFFGSRSRFERNAADDAFEADAWTTGSGALELIPGLGLADIPVSLGRAGLRSGLRAAGREVPEALARPTRLSEVQVPGAMTETYRGNRNAALAAGGIGAGYEALDGEFGDDPIPSALVGAGTVAALRQGMGPRIAGEAAEGTLQARRIGDEPSPIDVEAFPVEGPADAVARPVGAGVGEDVLSGVSARQPARDFQAAIRDPETGQVYTGLDHVEAIESVADPAVRARLDAIYRAPTEDAASVGFVVGGQFMGREEGLQAMRAARRRPVAQGQQLNRRTDTVEPASPIDYDAPDVRLRSDLGMGEDGRFIAGAGAGAIAGGGIGAAMNSEAQAADGSDPSDPLSEVVVPILGPAVGAATLGALVSRGRGGRGASRAIGEVSRTADNVAMPGDAARLPQNRTTARSWVESMGGGDEGEARALAYLTRQIEGERHPLIRADLEQMAASIQDRSYAQGERGMFSRDVEEAFPEIYSPSSGAEQMPRTEAAMTPEQTRLAGMLSDLEDQYRRSLSFGTPQIQNDLIQRMGAVRQLLDSPDASAGFDAATLARLETEMAELYRTPNTGPRRADLMATMPAMRNELRATGESETPFRDMFDGSVGMSGGRPSRRAIGEDPLAGVEPSNQRLNGEGQRTGNASGTEADFLEALPTNPEQWREAMALHPWINSPSRAQAIIMASARNADGSFVYSTNEIVAATGMTSESSLNATLSKARAAGVPIPRRRSGPEGSTAPPGGSRIARILDIMEQAERNGSTVTPAEIAERLRISRDSVETILSQVRHTSNSVRNIPDSVRQRLAALDAARTGRSRTNRNGAVAGGIGVGAGGLGLAAFGDAEAQEDGVIERDGILIDAASQDFPSARDFESVEVVGDMEIRAYSDGSRHVFRVNREGERPTIEYLGAYAGENFETPPVGDYYTNPYDPGMANPDDYRDIAPPADEGSNDLLPRVFPAAVAGLGGRYLASRMGARGAAREAWTFGPAALTDVYDNGPEDLPGTGLVALAPVAAAYGARTVIPAIREASEDTLAGVTDAARRPRLDADLLADPEFVARRRAFARELPMDAPRSRAIGEPDPMRATPSADRDMPIADGRLSAYSEFMAASPTDQLLWMDRLDFVPRPDASRAELGRQVAQRAIGQDIADLPALPPPAAAAEPGGPPPMNRKFRTPLEDVAPRTVAQRAGSRPAREVLNTFAEQHGIPRGRTNTETAANIKAAALRDERVRQAMRDWGMAAILGALGLGSVATAPEAEAQAR